MPSAIFAADFTSFTRAIDGAVVKLKSLEAGSATAGRMVNRITEQFSGAKLIQDALATEAAIKRLGGTAALTGDELKQAGGKADAALEKLRQLSAAGVKIDIPQESITRLQGLSTAASELPNKLTLSARAAQFAQSQFTQMFSAFTASALIDKAVTSIISFGTEAFAAAGKVDDLSAKTGLSAKTIQQMDFVAQQNSETLESMTDASYRLGVRIAGGSDSVAAAYDKLGLSITAIQQMDPDEQWNATVVALGKVEDATERNRLGTEIFGKSFAGIAASVGSNYAQMAADANASSDAQIRALAAAGDAIDRWKKAAQNAATSGMGQFALAMEAAMSGSDTAVRALVAGSLTGPSGIIAALAKVREAELAAAEAGKRTADVNLDQKKAAADYATQLRELDKQVAALSATKRADIDAGKKLGASEQAIADRLGLSEDVVRRYTGTLKENTKEKKDNEAATRKLAEAHAARFQQPVLANQAQDSAWLFNLAGPRGGGAERLNEAVTANMRTWMASIEPPDTSRLGGEFVNQVSKDFAYAFNRQPPTIPKSAIDQSATTFSKTFATQIGSSLGPAIMGALQGGGNLAQSFGGAFGMAATEGLFGKGSKLGTSLAKNLPGMFGDVLGSVLPGIGALAGPAIQGVTKLFSKMFGGEGRETKKKRGEFLDQFGGADAFKKLAADAGVADSAIAKLFSTKKVKDFEAAAKSATDQINRFQSEQAADQERLNAAIEKYGITLEELGGKLQQSKLDEQAKELIEDWRVLVGAGVDMGAVNARMSESINEYLQTALKVGAEIPAAMKPILERMAAQGVLTDEAGNKIEDLEAAGVTFAESMTQGFDRVVTKLDELIQKLIGAGDTIASLPPIQRDVDVVYRYHNEPPPMESLNAYGMPGFKTGTGGRYLDFGAGTPVMLHGRERVVTEGEAAGASAGMLAMTSSINALQLVMLRAIRENALTVRDQTLIALGR